MQTLIAAVWIHLGRGRYVHAMPAIHSTGIGCISSAFGTLASFHITISSPNGWPESSCWFVVSNAKGLLLINLRFHVPTGKSVPSRCPYMFFHLTVEHRQSTPKSLIHEESASKGSFQGFWSGFHSPVPFKGLCVLCSWGYRITTIKICRFVPQVEAGWARSFGRHLPKVTQNPTG